MRLTIIIPTVNRAYCVGRAVESALAQTSPDIEIIVSDNGSTDNTRSVLSRYVDPRLRLFYHESTMPVAVHSNLLIGKAEGELVVGLSDDDYLEPRFADRMLDLFKRRPDLSFAYARCWVHVGDRAFASPPAPEAEDSLPFFQSYFAGERHLFWCACVSRTDALRRLFPIPSNVQLGDMYLWTQLAFDGPVGCVPEVLAHYTYLVDNASLGIPVCDWADETSRLIERIKDRYVSSGESAAVIANLSKCMSRYLARTTANQFALNSARGTKKRDLLRALTTCGPHLLGDLTTAVPRTIAALTLPAPVIKKLVRVFATSRSRWASAPAANGGRGQRGRALV
jgi:hypothetical protein